VQEEDIKQGDIFEEYRRLSTEDTRFCFEGVPRGNVSIPGCGLQTQTHQFDKTSFGYATCVRCESLFQTPRPSQKCFERFYNDSVSSRYWAEEFFPVVAEVRRKK